MGVYENTMIKLEEMANANTAKQMTWQKSMSDTSHQREVKDLIKAGLNPVLSAGGQGAASYTTSVDSAVNAIGNMASAKEGADSTRYAAQQSAAATRYAAQQSAAAQRYAAQMNLAAANAQYAAQKYHSDKAYEASVYGSKMNYKAHIDQPVTKPTAILDKFLTKTGIYDKLGGEVRKGLNKVVQKPTQYLTSVGSSNRISVNSFAMTSAGVSQFNKLLRGMNISQNQNTRNLACKAFVFGDKKAYNTLVTLAPRKSKNSAKSLKMKGF